jgi:hypothetical protein
MNSHCYGLLSIIAAYDQLVSPKRHYTIGGEGVKLTFRHNIHDY